MKTITAVQFSNGSYWFMNRALDDEEMDKYWNASILDIPDEEFDRLNDCNRTKVPEVEEWVMKRLDEIIF